MENYNVSNKKPHHGHNVKRFRCLRQKIQQEIAELFGKSINWVHELEKRDVIEDEILLPISELLSVHIDVLKNFTEDCELQINVGTNSGNLGKDIEIDTYNDNDLAAITAAMKPIYDEVADLKLILYKKDQEILQLKRKLKGK